MPYPFRSQRRSYQPPPRPPYKAPTPLKEAKSDMDRDETDDHPTETVDDESAAAVARLFGLESGGSAGEPLEP